MKIEFTTLMIHLILGNTKRKTIRKSYLMRILYVDWLIRNVGGFALSDEAFEQAKIITAGKKLPRKDTEIIKENQLHLLIQKTLRLEF